MAPLSPSQVTFTAQDAIFGKNEIESLFKLTERNFQDLPNQLSPPKPEDVKQFLYSVFGQTHNVLFENDIYQREAPCIARAGQFFVKGQYTDVQNEHNIWQQNIAANNWDGQIVNTSWFLAVQSGIFDRNLKKILRDLQTRGEVSAEQCGAADHVTFFTGDDPQAVELWETIIRQTFPLHVFTLDPITEEQNAYDAFSRRRELQLAMAFSVAKGTVFTADQKLKMSRALALDEATIALNRTVVGFAHGDDTFGWYFHPRIQTPPTESTNIGALARTIWSTGPTEHYDRKHRRLEPGIRECEVLIAMPSFVTEISFDVTTNWEKIARPGVTKRSYEEMIAQGARIHQLQTCMQDPANQQCYRPGDYARLRSRIDQLETMLGLQTYNVNLPYQYEQTGSGLFDTGKKQQRPTIDFYYGLSYLDPEQTVADFFIAGKNFHPTLTHVIVGGSEQHLNDSDETVEVISRELLRVRVAKLNDKLSKDDRFEVRVATPAGMSNLLVIDKKPEPPAPPKTEKSVYDLADEAKLSGSIGCSKAPAVGCETAFCLNNPPGDLRIVVKSSHPYIVNDGWARFTLERQRQIENSADLDTTRLGTTEEVRITDLRVAISDFEAAIGKLIEQKDDYKEGDVIVAKGTLLFPGTTQPDVTMTSRISITLSISACRLPACSPEEVMPVEPALEPAPKAEPGPMPEAPAKSSSFRLNDRAKQRR